MYRLRTFVTAAALTALTATAAWPLTLSVQLTPKGLSAGQRSFTITTKDVGEYKEFDVTMTVEPGGPKFSPFIRGDLTLNTMSDHIALVRLEPKREGNRISFWFRVAPPAIESSRFEIGEQLYGIRLNPDGSPVRDERGQPVFEQQIGGTEYWFMLRGFARPRPTSFEDRAPAR